jgi:hypothetical protein
MVVVSKKAKGIDLDAVHFLISSESGMKEVAKFWCGLKPKTT